MKKNIPKPTNFGVNLKSLRKQSGLSQGAFAELMDISRNSIASYENGMVEPSASNFIKICNYFEVSPLEMMVSNLNERNEGSQHSKDVKSYVHDSFGEFLSQTNEITKVFEGYSAFYEMRKNSSDVQDTSGLTMILDDLFVLLKSLIKENWNLIKHVYPQYTTDGLSADEEKS